jgi:hypothetical protein
MKLYDKIGNILKLYSHTSEYSELKDLFLLHKNNTEKKSKLVLVQCVEDPFYFTTFAKIASDLSLNENIIVKQYVVRNFSVASHHSILRLFKSSIYSNYYTDIKWIKLYSSFCSDVAFRNEESVGIITDIKLFFQAYQLTKKLTSKAMLINLRVSDINIGDLVYDTYLRFKPAPTVDLDDIYLVFVVWKALRNIIITKKYFSKEVPDILLQSYSTYIQHGIATRIALIYGVNVFTFGNYQQVSKQLALSDFMHASNTTAYKDEFSRLNNKNEKLNMAKKALESRLMGSIDNATLYMKQSAYKIVEKEVPNVKGSVVIFLHDFYDSPHCYNSMVFADFLEWIEYTIEELDKYNIPYFLKSHPNQVSDSEKVVNELCLKYSNIKLISSKVTNKQLVNAGMKAGITVYGTIAHELAYMGIPIVTCGDNPHSSYNFCFEATSIDEYTDILSNIMSLEYDNAELIKSEVLSFYYMHNLNQSKEIQKNIIYFNKLRGYLDSNILNIDLEQVENMLSKINFQEICETI